MVSATPWAFASRSARFIVFLVSLRSVFRHTSVVSTCSTSYATKRGCRDSQFLSMVFIKLHAITLLLQQHLLKPLEAQLFLSLPTACVTGYSWPFKYSMYKVLTFSSPSLKPKGVSPSKSTLAIWRAAALSLGV